MPKYYCDYCDTFLTHDSASVRKSHIDGVRHQAAVRAYYAQLDTEHQEAPDREAMRYEKMKDDAMQFMMLPMPMGPIGGFPPMLPPPNFMPTYNPYGAPPPQNNAPRYDNRGPPRKDDGWNDRRGPGRQDGRGPRSDEGSQSYAASSSESRWDERKEPYSDAKADQSRGYTSSAPRDDGRGPRNDGYAPQHGQGYASSSQPWR